MVIKNVVQSLDRVASGDLRRLHEGRPEGLRYENLVEDSTPVRG